MADEKKDEGAVEKTAEELAADEVVEAAEVEDGFAAGFAEARGEEPPAQKEPAAKPDGDKDAGQAQGQEQEQAAEDPAKAAAAAAAADPWAGVAPGVRSAIETLTTQVGKVESLAKTAVGRVGAVQAALDAQKKAQQAGKPAPSQEQIQKAAAATESWKKLKEEYPDWAGPMEEQLAALRAEIPKAQAQAPVDVEALKRDMVDTFAPALAAAERRAREFAQVDIKHEGWEELVNTDGFKAWLPQQPDDVKRLAASPRGRDAIALLDKYKGHAAAQAAATKAGDKNKSRLEAAVPATDGKTTSAQRQAAVQSEEEAFQAGFKAVRGGT